jgi:hypothetical protein
MGFFLFLTIMPICFRDYHSLKTVLKIKKIKLFLRGFVLLILINIRHLLRLVLNFGMFTDT